jgi:hypothetical protein
MEKNTSEFMENQQGVWLQTSEVVENQHGFRVSKRPVRILQNPVPENPKRVQRTDHLLQGTQKQKGVLDPSDVAGKGSFPGTERDRGSDLRNIDGRHCDIQNATKNLREVHCDIPNVTKKFKESSTVEQQSSFRGWQAFSTMGWAWGGSKPTASFMEG